MKKRKALKLAVVCLFVGVALGFYWSRKLPRREAADFDSYADRGAALNSIGDKDAEPGAIVVDFGDDVSPAEVEKVGQALGIHFRAASDETAVDRLYLANVDPAVEMKDLAALRNDPRVDAAEEALVFTLPENALPASDEGIRDVSPARGKGFPNDPRAGEQWHMDQIHMPEAWPGATGKGVIVAVIDTGVAHVQDLAQTEFVPGWNFVNNTDNADDDHGHGTHVAGTIAQSTHNGIGVAGIAYEAKIMPIKVLSAGGSGTVAGIAQGIRWASDHGAKVINMSLGGPMSSLVLKNAVKYAHDHGTTVVCAAGNDGRGRVSYPAAYPGTIAVAATQKDEKTTFYSNWGKQITLAAPGGNVREGASGGVLQNTRYNGVDDYYFFMGTSMASPHVAGVAALVVSQGVTDPDAVKDVLVSTARSPEGLTNKPEDYAAHYGAGVMDAAAAVKKAQAKTGGLPLAFGGALALGALALLRRKNVLGGFGVAGIAGLVVGASGLWFASWIPGLSHVTEHLSALPGASLLLHGFPAWDQSLLGARGHGNPLFYSALAPIGLAALFYGARRLRGLLAGFALGVAGHLLAQAIAPTVDIRFIPFDAAWLGLNAAAAALCGVLVARK